MQELYTFVCEFRGGTYISQVRADDEVQAVRNWAELLVRERPMSRPSSYIARNAIQDLDWLDLPVAIRDLVGVWCISGIVGGDLYLTDIVRTSHLTTHDSQ